MSAVYIRAGSQYIILLLWLPPQTNYVGIRYGIIKTVVGRCAIYICDACVYVYDVIIYIYMGVSGHTEYRINR